MEKIDSLKDPEKFLHFFKKSCQFDFENGMNLTIIKPGHITYEMTILKKHLSTPTNCHGGVVAGLMDATLGLAALSMAVTEGNICSTVELKLNYLNPVLLGDQLIGSGDIDFKGKSLVVTNGSIKNMNKDILVAKGMGTFNLYPMNKMKGFNE